jgi:CheY-like chemotaxis protein
MRSADDVTVLVVDDDPDVVTYLASILEDGGLNVVTAGDGFAALDRIRERPPDLISLDLVMPGKSGIRLLHELHKSAQWSHIPVIIVSGHTRDAGVRRDLDEVLADSTISGPSAYLEKPVTPQKYLEHVCRILGVELSPAAGERPATDLREEAEALVRGADPVLLEEILARYGRRARTGPTKGGKGEEP